MIDQGHGEDENNEIRIINLQIQFYTKQEPHIIIMVTIISYTQFLGLHGIFSFYIICQKLFKKSA